MNSSKAYELEHGTEKRIITNMKLIDKKAKYIFFYI